jgi:hypothetical protein
MSIIDWDWIQAQIDRLYGLPGWAMTVMGCIVVGYVLKGVKSFPNGVIPVFVVTFGCILGVFFAGENPAKYDHFEWLIRNGVIGIVLGFIAWALHAQLIKRVEEKIPFLRGLSEQLAEQENTNGKTVPPVAPSGHDSNTPGGL